MNTNNEKLVEAYHKLLEALKTGWQETEKHALPPLKEGLETAKQKLSDWGEVTREELDDVQVADGDRFEIVQFVGGG